MKDTIQKIKRNINKACSFLLVSFVCLSMLSINVSHAEPGDQVAIIKGAESGIVICGKGNDPKDACTISKIFEQASNLAGFIIKILFPAMFFFGLFMIAFPLVNIFQGEVSPEAIATAKKRGKLLLMGTVFVIGSFLIVKSILTTLDYNGADTIVNPIKSNVNSSSSPTSYIFIEKAYAQSTGTSKDALSFIPNPLKNIEVQKAMLGVANIFVFIIITLCILGIIRGVLFLLLTQENPENLERGKKWIIRSLIAAAIVLGAQLMYSLIVDTVSSIFG